jgi:hypothetical protein
MPQDFSAAAGGRLGDTKWSIIMVVTIGAVGYTFNPEL